ncbi:hypothetical protein ACS0TY_026096 [Phlomoides rotata]
MRILGYNIRGLGCKAKCKEVSDLIRTKKVDFCLIQETKKVEVHKVLCKSLWGVGKVGWVYKGSLG